MKKVLVTEYMNATVRWDRTFEIPDHLEAEYLKDPTDIEWIDCNGTCIEDTCDIEDIQDTIETEVEEIFVPKSLGFL